MLFPTNADLRQRNARIRAPATQRSGFFFSRFICIFRSNKVIKYRIQTTFAFGEKFMGPNSSNYLPLLRKPDWKMVSHAFLRPRAMIYRLVNHEIEFNKTC